MSRSLTDDLKGSFKAVMGVGAGETSLIRVGLREIMGFPGGSEGKASACSAGDPGSIPMLGRSPGEGNGYPLQYCGLKNSMDCIVHGVAELDTTEQLSLPGGSDGKASACNAGDLGSVPGLGRSPGGGVDNPLQYSCLENPTDRGTWWSTVYGVVEESDMT